MLNCSYSHFTILEHMDCAHQNKFQLEDMGPFLMSKYAKVSSIRPRTSFMLAKSKDCLRLWRLQAGDKHALWCLELVHDLIEATYYWREFRHWCFSSMIKWSSLTPKPFLYQLSLPFLGPWCVIRFLTILFHFLKKTLEHYDESWTWNL